MTLIWSPEALQDLSDIRAFISRDDPSAAKTVVARIVRLVSEQLPDSPEIGRPGRVSNTRELVISNTPFVVPYRIRNQRIDILRDYHSSRMWSECL
jgi:toxin ParE1/3/4